MLSKTALAVALTLASATAMARAADTPAAPASPAAPAAAASADVQKTIAGLYQLNCTAALDPSDKNFDAAAATLATDFVDIDPKGKQHTRDEVVSMGKQQLKIMHATQCDNALASVTAPDANTVVVIDNMTMAGDVQTPDGKHEFSLVQKAEDTWKLVNGTWQESQSKTLHVVVKVDGSVAQDEGE